MASSCNVLNYRDQGLDQLAASLPLLQPSSANLRLIQPSSFLDYQDPVLFMICYCSRVLEV
jgi:hypothetical protein